MGNFHLSDVGDLRIKAEDSDSGAVFYTDVAKDSGGRGEHFSPTDLVAVSLGQCILTILSILATRMKVELGRPTAEVSKVVSEKPPVRFQKIEVHVKVPVEVDPDVASKLEQGTEHYCPVHAALNPEIEKVVTFEWGAA